MRGVPLAATEDDARFHEARFQQAIAIFANSDVKYDSNELRAKEYGVKAKRQITYVPAIDVSSADTIRERPDAVLQKKTWSMRHDRECGDL